MPNENDWVLNGPYSDKALMRNVLAYELAAEMGQYAPRTAHVELYLDGDNKGTNDASADLRARVRSLPDSD